MSYEDRQAQKARDVARQNDRYKKWSQMIPAPQPRVARNEPAEYVPRQGYRKTGS